MGTGIGQRLGMYYITKFISIIFSPLFYKFSINLIEEKCNLSGHEGKKRKEKERRKIQERGNTLLCN